MRALMGELAKIVRKDPKGREALRRFAAEGAERAIIELSDGRKFIVSTQKGQSST